jgi:hypothetical protein
MPEGRRELRTDTVSQPPARPSCGILQRRIGNTVAAAHGGRPARKPPLVERSPEVAPLRARSTRGSRYSQDLPVGRSLPDRCSGGGPHRRSQSTATPIASALPQPAIGQIDRTSRGVIPRSGQSRSRFKSLAKSPDTIVDKVGSATITPSHACGTSHGGNPKSRREATFGSDGIGRYLGIRISVRPDCRRDAPCQGFGPPDAVAP